MSTFKQDIIDLKANNYLMTAKELLHRYNNEWSELYHSNNNVDNIRADSILADFMYLEKDIINNEIYNQGRY